MSVDKLVRAEVVPFGKYKNQPIEVLIQDQSYRDWLMAQPWFRERFGNVYQTIINYGGEPQDSPEHNEMQVSFLDDGRCLRLARLLYPSRSFDQSEVKYSNTSAKGYSHGELHRRFARHLEMTFDPPSISGRRFEDAGWDVTFRVEPAAGWLEVKSLPLCTCQSCDHLDCDEGSTCRDPLGSHPARGWCRHRRCDDRFVPTFAWFEASDYQEVRSRMGLSDRHHEECAWGDRSAAEWLLRPIDEVRCYQPVGSGVVRVELKPDIGDDFPSVLRQVKRYDTEGYHDRRCVIVRRASFDRVTWDQVVEIFNASRVTLMREADLEVAEVTDGG